MIQKCDRVYLPEFGWNGTVNYVEGEQCEVCMDHPIYTEGYKPYPIWSIRFLVENVVRIEPEEKV